MTDLKSHFLLDPTITFLNFGSFGACPRPVFEDYQRWQLELEQEPVQFITVNGLTYLRQSREALAAYLNCGADDLVYITNPSYGINIIAKSLVLKPGDEILTTDLEYGACDKTWNYYCEKTGATYVRQPVKLPVTSKEEIVEQFFKGLSAKTKLIFISHITSSTALILPVREICAKARELGIMTFVDGAHAPAHVRLDLKEIDADIYTGACHKWMLAPKGCSFLYVKPNLQHLFDPLVVSWGYDSAFPSHSRFLDYHQMQGTRDFSAFLTVPKAIKFMEENNWTEVSAACRKLVQDHAQRFCNLLSTGPLCPLTDEFIGQMFSIQVRTPQPEILQKTLFDQYRIEIPVMRHGTKTFLRYSINAFNTEADLDKLYHALSAIIDKGEYLM